MHFVLRKTLKVVDAAINEVVFSPKNNLAAITAFKDIQIIRTDTLKIVHVLRGHSDVINCMRLSPDGYTLASGDYGGTICLWNMTTGKQVSLFKPGFYNPVQNITFSPDGKTFATGTDDGIAKLWSAMSGKLLRKYVGPKGRIDSLVFSPKGDLLATSCEDTTIESLRNSTRLVFCVL